jgi:hypothetical protein
VVKKLSHGIVPSVRAGQELRTLRRVAVGNAMGDKNANGILTGSRSGVGHLIVHRLVAGWRALPSV